MFFAWVIIVSVLLGVLSIYALCEKRHSYRTSYLIWIFSIALCGSVINLLVILFG